MSLTFYTQPHQMTFVDPLGNVESASALHPSTSYQVYFVIQNDGTALERNVQVEVTHSAFGINLPGGATQIAQPKPVDVPPKGPGGNGLATVMFEFATPAGGHGCLSAKILPAGPALPQNMDIAGVPVGQVSNLSFLVFNPTSAPQAITLKLTETETDLSGATISVPPAQTWDPRFVAPSDTTPSGSNPSAYELHLNANSYRSIGMEVQVPATAANQHGFRVDGYVAGQFVNSIWRDLKPIPVAEYAPPEPYVIGGWQSPDIILRYPYDPANPASGAVIPLGGDPGHPKDTTLTPKQKYGFGARVHNASRTIAKHVQVYFWDSGGGTGGMGSLIDVQTVTVPAGGCAEVYAAKPFVGPSVSQHSKCAVIGIYDSLAKTCNHAWPTNTLPEITPCNKRSCSAWRNTVARIICLKEPWHIYLYTRYWLPSPPPVDVDVRAFLVEAEWARTEEVQAIANRIRENPIWRSTPLYLLPEIRERLAPMNLEDIKLEIVSEAPTERAHARIPAAQGFRLSPVAQRRTIPFEISGVAPARAQKGDVLLVEVTAHYPETENDPGRSIQYLEILHLTDALG